MVNMIYAYYRVSTSRQDYESQKTGVIQYCAQHNLNIDREFLDDGISGMVMAKNRNLGKLLKILQPGDTIITSELSRLGRSTVDVINTCNQIAQKQANCYMIKQAMQIDQTIMGKLMIAIFSAFAEMERDLIAQRTKEAFARKRALGHKLGRPFGCKNKKHILDGKADIILNLKKAGTSNRQIAKKLKVSPSTINVFFECHR